MKITADRKALADLITWVSLVVPKRPQTRTLAGIKLVASADGLVASSFDYDVSHEGTLAVTVLDTGTALVPAAFLKSILTSLKGKEVTLTVDAGRVTIESGRSQYVARCLDLADYPTLPTLPESCGTIDASALAGAMGDVAWAASRDAMIPAITAMELASDGTTLTLTCTDRFVVGRAEIPLTGSPFSVTPPAPVIAAALAGMAGDLTIHADDKMVAISGAGRTVTSRLIADEFPQVSQLLDRAPAPVVVITADTGDLAEAAKRAGLMVDDKSGRIEISPDDFGLRVSVDESAEGAATEYVDAEVDAAPGSWADQDWVIGFNPTYLASALGVSNSTVRIEISDPQKPAYVRPDDKPGTVLMVMPKRVLK